MAWKSSVSYEKVSNLFACRFQTFVERNHELQQPVSSTSSVLAKDLCFQYAKCLVDCIRNLQQPGDKTNDAVTLKSERQRVCQSLVTLLNEKIENPQEWKVSATELCKQLMEAYKNISAKEYLVVYLVSDFFQQEAVTCMLADGIEAREASLGSSINNKETNSSSKQSNWLPRLLQQVSQVKGGLTFLYDLRRDISFQIGKIVSNDPIYKKLNYLKENIEKEIEKQCSSNAFHLIQVSSSSPPDLLYRYLEEMNWSGKRNISEREITLKRLQNGHRFSLHAFVPTNMNDIMAFAKEPDEDSGHTLSIAVIYGMKALYSNYGELLYRNCLNKLFDEQLRAVYPPLRGIVTHSRSHRFVAWLQDQLYIMDHFNENRERQSELVVKWDCLDRLRPLLNLLRGSYPTYIPQPELIKNITSELQHHKDELLSLFAYFVVRGWKFSRFMDPSLLFHLRCGAELYQINWLGEKTWDALKNFAGITFNFLYDVRDMESNSMAYLDKGEVVISEQVMELLKKQVVVEKILSADKLDS
eukprot:jgi/Galph1/3265/GphlegSOOS_G1918.1